MSSRNSYRKRLAAANAALALLHERFPGVFVLKHWELHRPLAVGVDKALIALELLPELEIRAALMLYTRRPMYQRSLIADAGRIDLDGNAVGSVSDEQAAQAATWVLQDEAEAIEQVRAVKEARKQQWKGELQQGKRTPKVWPVCPPKALQQSSQASKAAARAEHMGARFSSNGSSRSSSNGAGNSQSATSVAAPTLSSAQRKAGPSATVVAAPGPRRLSLSDLRAAYHSRQAALAKA